MKLNATAGNDLVSLVAVNVDGDTVTSDHAPSLPITAVRFRIVGVTLYDKPTIRSVHSIVYSLVRFVHEKPVSRVDQSELHEVPSTGVSRAIASSSSSTTDKVLVFRLSSSWFDSLLREYALVFDVAT